MVQWRMLVPMTLPDGLLTSSEIVARRDISIRTLRRWVKDGRLAPAYQLPGKTGAHLFRLEDVDQAIAQQRRARVVAGYGDAARAEGTE